MAEHASGPVETGAAMDYSEHDKTYHMFLNGAKYGTLVLSALMIAMAVLFFSGAGFFASFLVFVFVCIAGAYILR